MLTVGSAVHCTVLTGLSGMLTVVTQVGQCCTLHSVNTDPVHWFTMLTVVPLLVGPLAAAHIMQWAHFQFHPFRHQRHHHRHHS